MWVGCVVALVVGAGVLIDDIKKKKKGKEEEKNKEKIEDKIEDKKQDMQSEKLYFMTYITWNRLNFF